MPAIRLVPFGEQHLPGFRVLLNDASARRYTRVPEPLPLDFERTCIDAYQRGKADGTRMYFAIEQSSDAAFLGVAVVPHLDHDERTAELGYVLVSAARGRGAATEALQGLYVKQDLPEDTESWSRLSTDT